MASVTRPLASFNDGAGIVEFTFDDVSLLIQSVHVNNDGRRGTLTIDIPALSFTQQANVGNGFDRTLNVAPRNQHMVMVTGKGGVQTPQLPWDVTCSWSSAALR